MLHKVDFIMADVLQCEKEGFPLELDIPIRATAVLVDGVWEMAQFEVLGLLMSIPGDPPTIISGMACCDFPPEMESARHARKAASENMEGEEFKVWFNSHIIELLAMFDPINPPEDLTPPGLRGLLNEFVTPVSRASQKPVA